MSYIEPFELIFNNDPVKGITTGGFSVNSVMLKNGLSPIKTLNVNSSQSGGTNVSDLFENIVVPNWAYTYGSKIGGEQHNTKKYEEDDYVDDELHEKLLKLVTADIKHPVTKKRNTKKNNNNINNKGGTKKNK